MSVPSKVPNKAYIYQKRDGNYVILLNGEWPYGEIIGYALTLKGARRKARRAIKGIPPERELVEVVE